MANTHFKGPLIIASGDSTYTGSLAADNLKLDGNTLSSTSGAINITPIAGSAIVLDTSVSIDGGAVDVTGDLDVDNLNLNGNTIISTDTNGAINITPNGTGSIVLDTSVTVNAGAVDITGDLDVDNININGNTIISTDTNGAINITPNGTGSIVLDTSVTVNAGAVDITGDLDVDNININGNTIISTDTNGAINLTPNGTGATVITKPTLGASGSAMVKVVTGTIAVDPASIGDNDFGEVTLTLTGVAAGDIVILQPAAAGLTAGLAGCEARVSGANEVKVRIANLSGGAVDEASANWTYLWFDLT